MESDISLSLCSDQALVKSKPCLTEHLLHLGKRQFQSDGKCQHCRFGWLIEFIRANFGKEFPVNVCLLVALGIRHAAFVNLPHRALAW